MEYRVIEGSSTGELNALINGLARDGWRLCGPVAFVQETHDYQGGGFVTMQRETPSEPDESLSLDEIERRDFISFGDGDVRRRPVPPEPQDTRQGRIPR